MDPRNQSTRGRTIQARAPEGSEPMSAEKEKSVSAERISRDAQREANVTHSFSVKALRFLELELDENITGLVVAVALLLLFS